MYDAITCVRRLRMSTVAVNEQRVFYAQIKKTLMEIQIGVETVYIHSALSKPTSFKRMYHVLKRIFVEDRSKMTIGKVHCKFH